MPPTALGSSTPPPPAGPTFEAWLPALRWLCDDLATRLGAALRPDAAGKPAAALARPAAQGLGDVTFGLDLPAEAAIRDWHERLARHAAASVLTEDVGWRHLVPDGEGGFREVPGWDHGGPRIAFDPVDGTRNLMFDLRSAWTVVSFAGPGDGVPYLRDLSGGLVAELPTTRERLRRVLTAVAGEGCRYEERAVADGALLASRDLVVDSDDRADHGYFPFFRYQPALRPVIARVEADFLRRLVVHERAAEGTHYDDQYITNAGQLALVALGVYRVCVDARPHLAERAGVATTTAKPYDVAGAIVAARGSGAVVTDLEGSPLDFPLDCTTPISFAAWANDATFRRLLPHLRGALRSAGP